MPTVQSVIDVEAAPGPLFALAQDYGLRLLWDPFLRDMKFRGGATEAAVGVRVWVRARNGLAMEVEYITVRPPEQVAMKMTAGPWLFRQFSGAWLFRQVEAGRTRVTFRYNFAVRPRLLAPALDPVISRVLARDMQARLVGLRRGAEEQGLLQRLGG